MNNTKKRISLNGAKTVARLLFFGIVWTASLITNRAYAAGPIDYILTTSSDPIQPGNVIEFDATVRNLTASSQNVRLDFTVPDFTYYDYYTLYSAGTSNAYNFGTLQPGEVKTAQLHFTVVNSGSAPPDGTVISLTLEDQARGASISRNVVVRYTQDLTLKLSSQQATVAPGSQFTYTLASNNVGTGSLSGVMLTASVPTGASFVSADGGGTLNAGVVQWNLGTLATGANQQVHVTFKADTPASTLGPIEAVLSDSSGRIARASDTRVLYSTPPIQYTLTANPDPVKPGGVIEFDLTVHNFTAASQSVRLDFTVPDFTFYDYYSLYSGGTSNDVAFTLQAGETKTAQLHFTVVGSGTAPPDGTTINLDLVDRARGASISRSVVVRYTQDLTLKLSSQQATVAPGGQFTYTLASNNVGTGSLSGVTLTASIPPGASFVSADGGGTLNAGVVQWDLGTLAAGTNQQVHVTFKADSPASPLGPIDAVLGDASGHLTRASDTRVLNSTPPIQYTLTANPDPVTPGDVIEFDLTVRNLTAASQSVRLDFTVPDFTFYDYYSLYSGGTSNDVAFTLQAGETKTAQLHFTLVNSGSVAPDGTTINLDLIDLARGASISRNVVVRYTQNLTLKLSSQQATVAPGGQFTYTLASNNVGTGSLSGVTLTASVPTGASFVSADGGGTLSAGVVQWNLGTLATGANQQVHVTFKADTPASTLGPIEAVLSDSSGRIARASDTRVLYSTPPIQYTLTATPDPIKPGGVIEFDLTVHNLTAASQSVRLDFTVPDFTFYDNYSGYGGGTSNDVAFTLQAGETKTAQLHFTVVASGSAPPDGTTINLDLIDRARGASISRDVVVRSQVPPVPATPHYANIATRMTVGTGDNVLIAGFIVTGAQSKRVLLRGIGPSLTSLGVSGALADPTLTFYDSASKPIASNDNWKDSPDRQAISDTGIAPTNDAESAMLVSVAPGAYTAIFAGANNSTGIGLIEVYDLDPAANAELANISSRGRVGTGDDVMIGGIIIQSGQPTKIVVRAIGPSLPLSGTLADPTLELHNSNGDLIFSNNNWRDSQEADIQATGLAPSNDAESAIVATLGSGNYTAVVRGANDATGIAVVDAYDLQ